VGILILPTVDREGLLAACLGELERYRTSSRPRYICRGRISRALGTPSDLPDGGPDDASALGNIDFSSIPGQWRLREYLVSNRLTQTQLEMVHQKFIIPLIMRSAPQPKSSQDAVDRVLEYSYELVSSGVIELEQLTELIAQTCTSGAEQESA
jgi:hypothetical protein